MNHNKEQDFTAEVSKNRQGEAEAAEKNTSVFGVSAVPL
jgi:hypothetical protein